jgi:hypothetical protein
LSLGVALAAYGALLFLASPPWPDDWDGVGFVLAVRSFDLAKFVPHPPGYPVYIALLRLADVFARDPARACAAVAAGSGMLTVGFLWDAARRIRDSTVAWMVATIVAALPMVSRACSGVGSEAPALACAAACLWGLALGAGAEGVAIDPLARSGAGASRCLGAAAAVGLGAGLGLGVRLSWAPWFLAAVVTAPRGVPARAAGIAAFAVALWAVPLVAIVGASRAADLFFAHALGHAEVWGGTLATEPGVVRLVWLARDIFVDGFGVGADPLGVALAVVLCAAAALGISGARASSFASQRLAPVANGSVRRGLSSRVRLALLLNGPYLLWILVGQNLRAQPRHALPLVVCAAGGLAFLAARSRRAAAVGLALAACMTFRSVLDAVARRTIAPPGAQLLELAHRSASPGRVAVFGVSSVRFFELEGYRVPPASGRANPGGQPPEPPPQGYAASSLGDVQLTLSNLPRLPQHVWITGEVAREGQPRWPLVRIATLCRPARLDRRAPCLDVDEWKLPYLPAQ